VKTILLAGGGSGGHIAPGLAVAEAITSLGGFRAVFACSDREVDADMLSHAGQSFTTLPARPPRARPVGAARFLKSLWRSTRRSRDLIHDEDVACVVLLGGYVSVPVARAARSLGVPTLLVNLDRVPGRANRWLHSRVSQVTSAVTTVAPFADDVLGMPVREAARPPGDRTTCCHLLGLDPARPVLVAAGASQGAGTINELLPRLAECVHANHPEWQWVHLTGRHGYAQTLSRWKQVTPEPTLIDFRHDMGPVWGAADLVISRAGACSVAEITYAGRPAIYLPYPRHRDQHQRHNAMPALQAGAAILIEDLMDADRTLDALRQTTDVLWPGGDALTTLAAAAQARAGQHGAATIARAAAALAKDRK